MITNSHRSHSVGRSSGGLCTLLMLMAFSGQAHTLYNIPISEDIASFFDSNGCVTGKLEMAPTAPIVMQDHVTSTGAETDTTNQESHSNIPDYNNIGKEKTPMCLVNELARFNKIEHQYRLTNEEGPPHKKKFTVTLKFGNEEYTADGASIKKAQHAAASIALKNTAHKHPPPKSSRSQRGARGNITPTVELNALAMKRGEPTVYTLVESPQFGTGQYNGFVGYSHRGMFTQPYNEYGYSYAGKGKSYRGRFPAVVDPRFYGGKPALYKVVVKVGEREFSGEGITAQAARHDAASKALQLLTSLPVEETCPARNITCDGPIDPDATTELKSPISLVHEIALKRNLHVMFEVVSEKGQPHMRTFVTRCTVGDKFESIGEGNGKKVSKKRAAEKMLDLLRTLPPTTTVTAAGLVGSLSRMKRKSNTTKKKSRNLIKDTTVASTGPQPDQKYESDTTEDMNPISRLIQIQQAKREREPVYTLREERGIARRREFFMEVTMGEHSFIGTGPNKKMAKRNAAEGLLQQLGYSSSTVNRTGHPIQTNKQVRFNDEKSQPAGGTIGRQIVPGVILMTDQSATNGSPAKGSVKSSTTATIAKEYLTNGNSPTADALAGKKRGKSAPARPKDQLKYLAKTLNFQVQFSDFPKGNHKEFLSLVSVSTDPPQVCHGSGPTVDISHDRAAFNALRSLAEIGLDSITPKKETQSSTLPPVPAPENSYIHLPTMPTEEPLVNGN